MSRKSWYHIKNAADAPTAEISIHDEIGFWGVTAKDFLDELKSIPANRPIALSLHSPGGEVFDGLAIYHALKARGNVNVRIEGLAASMASVIAMAGTRIEMPRNAYLMIHNPSGVAMGDAADMRQLADLLDKLKGSLIAAYRDRTKKSDEDLTAMMDAETWLTGEEAVAQGFADELTDAVALSASAFKSSRLTAHLTHRPAALFDTPASSTAHADSPPYLNPAQMKALLALAKKIGIAFADNASEDEICNAIEAWQPPAKNVVIDFEDADVKAAFAARITDATAAEKAKIIALEGELANIKALITHGAAAAAGGAAAVAHAKPKEQMTIAEQYAVITDAAERTRFFNKHREELRKPSNFFAAAA
jgi:ATP-dependent Clp endopeptidase proteolytic subunit ClpP